MATITDDYVIVGADSDNFDCDDTGDWQTGGNAKDPTLSSNKIQGDYAFGLQTSDSDESWWYHDISEGNRFKIVEKDLGVWFYYIKGKGDNFLVQNSSAVVMRLYFGGTDKYADYHLTEKGDLSLKFGWQMLMCSGTELNGGDVGGGHDGDSDFYLDVHRIEFRINADNTVDVDLGLDAFFVGTTIEVQDGDENNPVTMDDLMDYTFNTRSFPIGTVEVTKKLANIKSGLTINGGYVSAENMYLLFNQMSSEVKHHVNIVDGTFRIGKNENGKAIDGCQIVKPEGKNADFIVGSNGIIKCYNSKFYRWREVKFEGNGELIYVDFDNCDLITINSVIGDQLSVHDSVNNVSEYAVEFSADTNNINDIIVYRNNNGIYFSNNCEVEKIRCLDNVNYDISIKDDVEVKLIDAIYDNIRRV